MDLKDAKRFLYKMNKIFNDVELRYFLFLGTLLGAIREKGFIPLDRDFDIGVFKEEFDTKKEELKRLCDRRGFQTKWKFPNVKAKKDNNPSGLCIYNPNIMKGFKTKKMHCDVCGFIKKGKWRYYPRSTKKLLVYPANLIEDLKEIKLYAIKVNVPFNAEKFLELTYGEDWRIPHTEFKAESGIGSQIELKNKDERWWLKKKEQ